MIVRLFPILGVMLYRFGLWFLASLAILMIYLFQLLYFVSISRCYFRLFALICFAGVFRRVLLLVFCCNLICYRFILLIRLSIMVTICCYYLFLDYLFVYFIS